jgi:predicted nucleotidyltransferase
VAGGDADRSRRLTVTGAPAPSLPPAVATLAARLAALPGAVAVALGGSRATGRSRPDSDWDLGLYYRGSARPIAPADVRRLGHDGYVSEVGEWGPIVNGGAWLIVDGAPVDVLFRDLDTIEAWLRDSEDGRFEVLTQDGYVAGAPTYVPVGELALCVPLSGTLPRPGFPAPLAAAAERWWSGRARVALMFAHAHARSSDAVCCAGMLAVAALSAAHARLAARREWALTEKLLMRRAGLGEVERLVGGPGATSDELAARVAAVGAALGVEPLRPR